MPAEAISAIESEFSVALGKPDRVAAACSSLADRIPVSESPDPGILSLLPLLQRRAGEIARPLADLLVATAHACDTPGAIVEGLIMARDPEIAVRGLDLAIDLAREGRFATGIGGIRLLARLVDAPGSPLADPPALDRIARIVLAAEIDGAPIGIDPLVALYLGRERLSLRRLAARLLDAPGAPVPPSRIERLLGRDAVRFLRPYIAYAQATHRDLLDLAPSGPLSPEILASLKEAEVRCGESLLRALIAEIGWSRLNLGLDVRPQIPISIDGSYPLFVPPSEASLFDRIPLARRAAPRILVVAHGGAPVEEGGAGAGEDRIARFRSYNLDHAEVLAEILDVAPLTRDRLRRILERMDRVVADFSFLFASYEEECAALPDAYRALRDRILDGAAPAAEDPPLSPEAMRLVVAFEDPVSLGDVHSLHGLKRYLHQKGLRLGFRLVEGGGRTNRTCDLAIASQERVLHLARRIQYVDFESDPTDDPPGGIPFPVELVVDGLGRALLHGTPTLPDVKAFCYGNEVHYYVSYGSHPAFLRVDYTPPLRGGMVDLEFYGVSKNELEQHPQPSLDAVGRIFRRLDFDCAIRRTRVEARYDKERALDLGDVCDKAAALFRLLPHLMELDWVIGSLRLPDDARVRVAEGWADFFVRWGVLPFDRFLTSDRTGILLAVEPGPDGGREVAWSGEGPYEDLAGRSIDGSSLRGQMRAIVAGLGFQEGIEPIETIPDGPVGQIAIEASLLRPIHESAGRRGGDLFRIDHEVERFAKIVAVGGEEAMRAMRLAPLIIPIERFLRFRMSGSVNGFDVETAPIPLGRDKGKISVLRDRAGMIRLGLFARRGTLHRSRQSRTAEWVEGGTSDPAEVASLLRRRGYAVAGSDPSPDAPEDIDALRAEILRGADGPSRGRRSVPGERIVNGVTASPGRAVGPVVFGTAGHSPADIEGKILVAEAIRPEDNAHLYRASGIVSTGGGVLSHAGLLAVQFGKPALMVPGRWETRRDGRLLLCKGIDYDEVVEERDGLTITMRRNLREREEPIREGDLAVLDGRESILLLLGSGAESLALHHELRALAETGRLLERASDDAIVLDLRGRRLRARHHLERLLARMSDIGIARHAVREILLGEASAGGGRGEAAHLLTILLANPRVGGEARGHAADVFREMIARSAAANEAARAGIPTADDEHEILALRLDALRSDSACEDVRLLLRDCGWMEEDEGRRAAAPAGIDGIAATRLAELRDDAIDACAEGGDGGIRHHLERVARIDAVLADRPGAAGRIDLKEIAGSLASADSASIVGNRGRAILTPRDGGIELAPLVGSKAANLAEVERILDAGFVPPWFVVTDHAFQLLHDLPLDIEGRKVTPGGLIDSILARDGTSDAQKSFLIRKLWEGLDVPDSLVSEIAGAYHDLARGGSILKGEGKGQGQGQGKAQGHGKAQEPGKGQAQGHGRWEEEEDEAPLVAVRSSGTEEDVAEATRAGEFESFLFVRGESDLILHVKRVLASFWTARAIHNRPLFGAGSGGGRGIVSDGARGSVHGGVLVQRIVRSRVSGVVQTINVAEGRMREIVVSAGLGLGEGIVSGTVGADLITIRKDGIEGDGPLRFRYLTNDKREKVVCDARRGSGTIRIETLYHERFRPALEYTELRDIARAARRLEIGYGIPLDIEFGIEGSSLKILQVRPLPLSAAVLRQTIERYPLRPVES